ncbi:protein maelstrom homolog [Cotesia glomerata]|uniref:Maelstrom domain-containing protein n=1 Tax=Cotesia glomerata TaxID=32391 RepID=A0AAV7HEN3_COTGL|nr:protein maelstrom homolog [Cotesia glomerata]KAH0535243.1 hypothetical protein KQX54_015396 [Cotesia glomerata]
MLKAAKKNGFYYFMMEFKERENQKGTKYCNSQDVKKNYRYENLWKSLSTEEKKIYHDKAREEMSNMCGKRTGLGEPIKFIIEQQMKHLNYELIMKEYINDIVDQVIGTGLGFNTFYFIHVNWYYTKTNVNTNEVDYIPAEFAVIELTLDQGIERIYHKIIKVIVETGYTLEALEHGGKTHKIDIYHEGNITDYKDLYDELVTFISCKKKWCEKLPPLFTLNKFKTVVTSFLKRITSAAGASEDTFDLYSLEYLFGTFMVDLKAIEGTDNRAALARAKLERDQFLYTADIECLYHRRIEGTEPYCSQSVVTQWAYTILNYCCPLMYIRMKAGKHRPYTIDELLSRGIQSMTVKEHRIFNVKSETGVTEAYREQKSAITRREEMLRRKQNRQITFIDHALKLSPENAHFWQ